MMNNWLHASERYCGEMDGEIGENRWGKSKRFSAEGVKKVIRKGWERQ